MKKTFVTISILLLTAVMLRAQELKAFIGANGKWGFKDQSGKEIVAPRYDRLPEFEEGMAAVSIGYEYGVKTGKWGFIDVTGKEVIPLKYEKVENFSGGLALVNTGGKYTDMGVATGGKWSYINKSGNEKITIPLKNVEWAGSFEEGLAVFMLKQGGTEKYGLIDIKGKIVQAARYDGIWSPFDGMRKIQLGDKFGYLNADKGKIVIEIQYDSAENFISGKAKVKKDNREFFIDKTGKETQ